MASGLKKWDVVLLSYPFSDLTGAKVRPAIVISPNIHNSMLDDAVFILITSNTDLGSSYDVLIEDNAPEFTATGLQKSSMIRVPKLWNLDQKLVKRTIGKIGPTLSAKVQKALNEFLQ